MIILRIIIPTELHVQIGEAIPDGSDIIHVASYHREWRQLHWRVLTARGIAWRLPRVTIYSEVHCEVGERNLLPLWRHQSI